MFGDDSKLRLRRNASEIFGGNPTTGSSTGTLLPLTSSWSSQHRSSPPHHQQQQQQQPKQATAPPMSYGQVKGRRKRRQRRRILYRWVRTCGSGLAAAMVWATLSYLFLPTSWYQVDYHHQVQQAATHIWQRVEEQRHNYATSMRGYSKRQQQQPHATRILCRDGTVGFVNDHYCDCADDGRDEPLTSACSHQLVQQKTFSCGSANGGGSNPPLVIYASRVGDGVPDCPDGSDERDIVR